MKRTTIYFDPELDIRLKVEALRRGQPMADLIREAVRTYLDQGTTAPPPGAGEFDSGTSDVAERAEEILAETGFGEAGSGEAHPSKTKKARTRRGR